MAVVSVVCYIMMFIACYSAMFVVNSDAVGDDSIGVDVVEASDKSKNTFNSPTEKEVNDKFAKYFEYATNMLQNATIRALLSPAKPRAVFKNGRRPGTPEQWGGHFQGDIVLPPLGRNGLIDPLQRWPNGGKVPYEIDPKINDASRNIFEGGLEEFRKNVKCFKFVPRKSTDENYIYVTDVHEGCYTSLGFSSGRTTLNLQNPGCTDSVGVAVHEMMHVAGFYHEQSREDRDDYLTIVIKNMNPDDVSQFDKASPGTTTAFGIPYMYGSIMHYQEDAFSINGLPTMIAKKITGSMGQRKGFIPSDIAKINMMYPTC